MKQQILIFSLLFARVLSFGAESTWESPQNRTRKRALIMPEITTFRYKKPGNPPGKVKSTLLNLPGCSVTGIFFGWHPAKRAAELDPIEAIRHE